MMEARIGLVAAMLGVVTLTGSTQQQAFDWARRHGGVNADGADAQEPALWQYESPAEIQRLELLDNGDIFVGTEQGVAVIGRADGRALWSRDDIRDCDTSWWDAAERLGGTVKCRFEGMRTKYARLPGTRYGAFQTDDDLHIVDLRTGRTTLGTKGGPIRKVIDYVYLPSRDQFLLHGESAEHRGAVLAAYDGQSGAVTWSAVTAITREFAWLRTASPKLRTFYGRTANGRRALGIVDLDAGRVLWEDDRLLRQEVKVRRRTQGNHYVRLFLPTVVQDTESSLLAFLSKDGLVRLTVDGQRAWQTEELSGQDPWDFAYSAGRVFMAGERRILSVDASSGDVIWEQPARIDATRTLLLPQGLFVIADEAIDLLAPNTGQARWPAPVRLGRKIPASFLLLDIQAAAIVAAGGDPAAWRSPVVIEGETLYHAGAERLARLDLTSGALVEVGSYTIPFGESPHVLERVESGFFIGARRSVLGLDSQGRVLLRKEYPAPRGSRWAELAGAALGAAVQGTIGGITGNESLLYGPLIFTSTAGDGGPPAGLEPGRAPTRSQRSYFYFQNAGGDASRQFGLVMFDHTQMKETSTAWINERQPQLALDWLDGIVYIKTGPNVIRAVKLGGG